eukprot:EG_transcript_3672
MYCTFGLRPEPESPPPAPDAATAPEGASSDIKVVFARFWEMAAPFWKTDTNPNARAAQLKLAGIIALSLATTGISVGFSFLGRDFYNFLSEKNVEGFWSQLRLYMIAIPCGIPFFVMRDYYSSQLKLEWRQWLAEHLIAQYLADRRFYHVETGALIDNPDQRITSDVSQFTATSLGFFFTIFSSVTDLISFAGILFSIYPPLFLVLIAYSIGGTAVSIKLGEPLVGLNFEQERREANFRYSLVRIRENAESIAFFNGERSERETLRQALQSAVDNLLQLLVTNRNLGFFTSYYQYLIGLLPAAVIAPLYFQGKVEFGVINQSASAFNHILGDVSLVVFEFSAIAGFAAVIDRLGQFTELLRQESPAGKGIATVNSATATSLLATDALTVATPDQSRVLLADLSLAVEAGQSVLLMGPSGSGKTSLLRALAGLWSQGAGQIQRAVADPARPYRDVFFVPQKPYMVLGSLRQQLLYPTWTELPPAAGAGAGGPADRPADAELEAVLREVRLDGLLARLAGAGSPLDAVSQWASVLSLGEQQRISFARLLLARPRLAILDEASSALDLDNEAHLYGLVQARGITCISVGHRPSLRAFHPKLLYLRPDGAGGPAMVIENPELDEAAPRTSATPAPRV